MNAIPKSRLIETLVHLADSYCAAAGQSRAMVAKIIFGRGGHFEDLQNGTRDLTTGSFERAMIWFADHWPSGAEWPEGVERLAAPLPADASDRPGSDSQ